MMLEGYMWTFNVSDSPFPISLNHPKLGEVGDLIGNRSLVHDDCRCKLKWLPPDLGELSLQLKNRIKQYEELLDRAKTP
jgi:hypothetical protein